MVRCSDCFSEYHAVLGTNFANALRTLRRSIEASLFDGLRQEARRRWNSEPWSIRMPILTTALTTDLAGIGLSRP